MTRTCARSSESARMTPMPTSSTATTWIGSARPSSRSSTWFHPIPSGTIPRSCWRWPGSDRGCAASTSGHSTTPSGSSPAAPRTSSTITSSPSCSRAGWPRRASSAPRSGRGPRALAWSSSTTRSASTTASSGPGPSTRGATAASPRSSPGPPPRSEPRSGSPRRLRGC